VGSLPEPQVPEKTLPVILRSDSADCRVLPLKILIAWGPQLPYRFAIPFPDARGPTVIFPGRAAAPIIRKSIFFRKPIILKHPFSGLPKFIAALQGMACGFENAHLRVVQVNENQYIQTYS